MFIGKNINLYVRSESRKNMLKNKKKKIFNYLIHFDLNVVDSREYETWNYNLDINAYVIQ